MNNKELSLADMKPKRDLSDPLESIAGSLEEISQALSYLNDTLGCIEIQLRDLTELTECISNTPRGKLLCVAGNVTTHEL